ncbi:hypothetical protein BJ508DRAFT_359667 [Ascobolus immersus RN42]|uniref:Uncharacterized protein n=1 Tax=Ascobolus immersus RN42 TaxID=1160509 RepID=A0A3N4IJD7_ASCIM|nr:hypothetical protein BJ508DRAFT_359667 [Ascobolus immersus RN42]
MTTYTHTSPHACSEVVQQPTQRNLICTLPLEVHFKIARFLLAETSESDLSSAELSYPLLCLQRTCRILRSTYSPSTLSQHVSCLENYIHALADELEASYREIDPEIPRGDCNALSRKDLEMVRGKVTKAEDISRRVVSLGLNGIHMFTKVWNSRPRTRYRMHLKDPRDKKYRMGWLSYKEYHRFSGKEYHNGHGVPYCRCSWKAEKQGLDEEQWHEDPARRERLIRNWLWVELLKGVIETFNSGTWHTPDNGSDAELKWDPEQVVRRRYEVYDGPLEEKERLAMLRFLLSDSGLAPSLGDGVYESGDDYDGSRYMSDVSCEMCSGYSPGFQRFTDFYGRYGKYDRRGDESGAVLSKDEVWFDDVMHLMLDIQHVGCMRVLIYSGGLEWRRWEMAKYNTADPYAYPRKVLKMMGFLEAIQDEKRAKWNPEFVGYLEGERRIAKIVLRIDRLLDSLTLRQRTEFNETRVVPNPAKEAAIQRMKEARRLRRKPFAANYGLGDEYDVPCKFVRDEKTGKSWFSYSDGE